MALQAKFDRKLAKIRDDVYPDGFRDIEWGEDTNLMDASTFRGSGGGARGVVVALGIHGGNGLSDTLVEVDVDTGADVVRRREDTDQNVFQSPRARAWMLFSQAANELPTDNRTRTILVAIGQGDDIRTVARRHRTTRWAVHQLVTRLCAAIKVESSWLFGPLGDDGDAAREKCRDCRRMAARGDTGGCRAHTREPMAAAG